MEWKQFWAVGVVALLLGGLTGGILFSSKTEVEVPADCNCEICEVCEESGSIQDVLNLLNEDKDWENNAKDIAVDEWSRRDYKDIYNAIDELLEDIDDREDIDRVIIKDTEYSGMDVDDQDAVITQKIKVYYEDLDGEDKKVYLKIVSEIEDGEVENQEISLD